MADIPRILFLGPRFAYRAISDYFSVGFDFIYSSSEPEEFGTKLQSASGVIDASMAVPITDNMIAASNNLQIISTATTGSDHIQRGEVSRRGIQIRTLKEDKELLRTITPAAEHTWALLLSVIRNLRGATHHVAEGLWRREEFPSLMLNGKTLGIVGCGRIGQWVAKYGTAFGMRVLGYDPYVEAWPGHIIPETLKKLVTSSDVISVHVHLTRDTDRLIDRELLESIKRGTILINTSRGAIVDECALLDSLNRGQMGGAGLDVLTGEPDISANPLVEYAKTHDNLLISPHCGGYSPDAVNIVCRRAAEKIVDYFQRIQ